VWFCPWAESGHVEFERLCGVLKTRTTMVIRRRRLPRADAASTTSTHGPIDITVNEPCRLFHALVLDPAAASRMSSPGPPPDAGTRTPPRAATTPGKPHRNLKRISCWRLN
jgi:hypothetical protein